MTKTTVAQTDCLGTANTQNTRDLTVSAHPKLTFQTTHFPAICRFHTTQVSPDYANPVSHLSVVPRFSCVTPPKQFVVSPISEQLHSEFF